MRLSMFRAPAALAGLVLLAGTVSILTLVQGMPQAIPSKQPASTFTKPDLYQLRGQQLQITYATSGIDGKPHFSYQDAHQTLQFTGDQIRTSPSDLGTLVSVTIRMTVDTGSTTFTLLVPRVNLDQSKTAPLVTEGITTVHHFSVVPNLNRGQVDVYTVTRLTGTARSVVF